MRYDLLFLAALYGLVLGSFCNAWAWRIVHGESISRGRSHCARCGHVLAPLDLIPLLSYLLLRGKCRYCGEPISRRYPAAEALMCVCWASVTWVHGLSWQTGRFLLLSCPLLVLSLVDLDTFELPDGLVAFSALCALVRFLEEGLFLPSGLLVGVGILAAVLVFDRITGKEGMGGGDLKLLLALGLHFPALELLLLLIFACVFGLLTGRRAQPFPFGPSIALAAWATALFGQEIIQRYLSLFGL